MTHRRRNVVEAQTAKPLPLFAANSKREIENLKRRHGLPDEFDLARGLRSIYYAARDLQILRLDPVPSTQQLKRFLTRLQSSVRDLQACLAGGSDTELSLLLYGSARPPRSPGPMAFSHSDLHALATLLARLDHAARKASAAPSQRGRRPQEYRRYVAGRLRGLYVEAIGERARRITKAETYGGAFFEFMSDALPLFGVRRMENKALGRLCESAIREVHEARSQSLTRANLRSALHPRK